MAGFGFGLRLPGLAARDKGAGARAWLPSDLGSTKVRAWHKSETFAPALWPDSSGNGVDFVQATGANQPIASPDGGARFDSAAKRMTSNLSASDNTAKMFVVGTLPSPGGNRTILGASADGGRQLFLTATGKMGVNKQNTASIADSNAVVVPNNRKFNFLFRINGASSSVQMDGSAVASPFAQAGTLTGSLTTLLGSKPAGSEPFYNATGGYGDVHEIVSCIGAITKQEEDRIVGYLAWKHGLQTYLPSDHPYKNEAPIYGVGSLYIGQVATRCQEPNALAASAFSTWMRSGTIHVARDAIHNPTLIWGNFYVKVDNGNTEAVVGAGQIQAAIEYPLGAAFTPCNEGEITFPNGNTSLTCNIDIPNGVEFRVWARVKNTNGTPYVAYDRAGQFDASSRDRGDNGTGTVPAFPTTASDVAAATNLVFPPIAIVASTRKSSFAIHGDSRSFGTAEDNSPSGDFGDAAAVIGTAFAYTKFTNNGGRLDHYLANRTYRGALQQYYSHILDQYGFNDRANGRTAAQVAADRATFAALYPNAVVIGTTMYNSTNSTDSWTTLANQTINPNDPESLNVLIRAGIANEAFYFDVDLGLDPGNIGKFPVGPPTTADGIHLLTVGRQIIAASGVIDLSRIVR